MIYFLAMKNEGIKKRLLDAARDDSRSFLEISTAAGLGRNYLSQMDNETKSPKPAAIMAICDVLGISPIYVFSGIPMDKEAEEILRLYSNADKKQQKAIKSMLEALVADK